MGDILKEKHMTCTDSAQGQSHHKRKENHLSGGSAITASLTIDMVESRSQQARAGGPSEGERLNDALKSATTPWPIECWIRGRKDIADDAMWHLRRASIAITTLVNDITGKRIRSAGQLGDWISAAKHDMVSLAAGKSFLAMYSLWCRNGTTILSRLIPACKLTSGRARLSRSLPSKPK